MIPPSPVTPALAAPAFASLTDSPADFVLLPLVCPVAPNRENVIPVHDRPRTADCAQSAFDGFWECGLEERHALRCARHVVSILGVVDADGSYESAVRSGRVVEHDLGAPTIGKSDRKCVFARR